MRKRITLLIIFSISIIGYAQTKETWFPSNLNIQPFTANLLEARDGALYLFNKKKIRLDIGTSADIIQIKRKHSTLSFGADLFTFTRLRSENNFKFPVETIDYFFGINSGYKIRKANISYGFRFRFSHISAHLVDGRYSMQQDSWINEYKPFVYSREFFELFPFYQINSFRAYAGITYLIHIIPDDIGHGIYQIGFDYYLPNLIAKKVNPFIAGDFKIDYMDGNYFGNSIIKAGIKFGKYNSRGFSILCSYYAGKSAHGELYNISENYFTIGFNVDI